MKMSKLTPGMKWLEETVLSGANVKIQMSLGGVGIFVFDVAAGHGPTVRAALDNVAEDAENE